MIALKLRKQLLVAESELQRAQLTVQLNQCATLVHGLIAQTQTYGSMLSSGATLLTGLTSLRGGPTPGSAPRLSWLPGFLKVAGVVSTVLLALRSRKHAAGRSSVPSPAPLPPPSSFPRP